MRKNILLHNAKLNMPAHALRLVNVFTGKQWEWVNSFMFTVFQSSANQGICIF